MPSRSSETMASSEFSTIAAWYWALWNTFRSEMSRANPAAATTWPVASRTGERDSEISNRVPSLRRRIVS